MTYIATNLTAILAATCAGLAVGVAYAGLYRRLAGGLETSVRRGTVGFGVLAFAAEFWLAAILAGALILAPPQAGAWTMSLGSAFIIWIGFVIPVIAVTHPFHALPGRVVCLDAAHWLVVMAAQAATLQVIGLAKP